MGVMKTKFKTFILVVLATITLMGLSATAQANTPQSCHDGHDLLLSHKYKKSIKKLSKCLKYNSLSIEIRALVYYKRSYAYQLLSYDEEDFEKADDLLYKAHDDIQKSIELDPVSTPLAYCHRGLIDLDLTWGTNGFKDLEKGIAMGAPEDLCNVNAPF